METLIHEINKTVDNVLEILHTTNDNDLDKKPSEDSWSIGQTIEHIIICGSGIPDRKTETSSRPMDEKIQVLKDIFLDMNAKSKAAPFLSPRELHHDKKILIDRVNNIRKVLTDTVNQKDLTPLCLDMEFPQVGFLTRYEWVNFILFHTQRHTIQARNIKNLLAELD